MRAVAVSQFGAQPQLVELPEPVPMPRALLVRLTAAAINPFDLTIANGWVRDRAPHTFPLILGVEGAGIVDAVGEGVTRFGVGDAVYGVFLHPPYGEGTYAQYITVPEDCWIVQPPANVPLTHAAAAPVGGMTALGLIEITRAGSDQTVLIVGASGGVGSFAVQMAAARNAHVIATAKENSQDRLRSLGAADVIDYVCRPVDEQVRELVPEGIDVLIDLVSSPVEFESHLRLVREGGHAVSTRYAANPTSAIAERVHVQNFNFSEEHGSLGLLGKLTSELERGNTNIDVQAEITLQEAATAVQASHSRGAQGKTVIHVSSSPADDVCERVR
jgi:NADPH:quinone reductase-like Zn-dependent oxidoreductase